jgi:hypothetical protein
VAATIGCTALIVIGLNLAAANGARPAEDWNRGEFIIASKWRLADRGVASDWLFVGDSTCLVGVDPKQWPAQMGPALNLCTVGDVLPLSDLYLLERQLEQVPAPPRRVVVMHAYDIYSRQLSLENFMLLPFGFARAVRLAVALPGFSADQQAAFALQVGVRKLFPLYGRRAQVLSKIGLGMARTYRHVPISPLGHMPTVKTSATEVEEDAMSHEQAVVREDAYQLSSYAHYTLDRIGALAERYRFTVYLVQSPLYRVLADSAPFSAFYRQYLTALVGASAHRRCIVPWLNEAWLYEADEMQNADHILPDQVAAFTHQLAGSLAQAPAPCS